MAYADAELLLTGWIKTQRGVRCVTDLPADLTSLPIVQVVRFGGSDDELTVDTPNIDVDVFHNDRASAFTLAEQIRSDIRLRLPGYSANGAVVTGVETISGPKWVPYDNTSLRRVSASYRVAIHSAP